MFMASDDPLPVGTRVEMDLRLKDRTPLICGKGEVRKVHRGGSKGGRPGMDIRFIYIDQPSKEIIKRLVENQLR
jgi:hypothetical protein